jgi:hypothetical protein
MVGVGLGNVALRHDLPEVTDRLPIRLADPRPTAEQRLRREAGEPR